MKGFAAIIKRELKSYLTSPVVYVYIAMFTLVCGYFFYRNFIYFSMLSMQGSYGSSGSMVLNITEAVFAPVHSNYLFVMLILVPLITMRVFSEEKKTGTLELLISFPVRYIDVVLAKLFSAFIVLAFTLALTLLFPLVASMYGRIEVIPVLTSYTGLFLVGLTFVAIGTFFSSLTENQIIAAVLSFGVILLLWAIEWTASFIPGVFGKILSEMSVYNHFRDFNRGVINSNDAIFFINISVFFAGLTLINLQRRTWKS
ncbi:ABC transporter permease [Marispirochaeta sp.]|jgi:ABC-2 type transport system permease protein|uniref:ABC transporter permease n=1 Tax=Marispirochaeta sp. TaxID=2038653 RepID=UPI0029C98A4A|nr:ABC transporter permease [Marispirochaeta sp.]